MKEYPVDLTYVGIGSAPHTPIETLFATPERDQLIPVFIRDQIGKKSIRILHFDPQLKKDVLHSYLCDRRMGFVYDPWKLHFWRSLRYNVEIVLLDFEFDYSNSFFDTITYNCTNANKQLIVQDYSGHDLQSDLIFRELFEASFQKDVFKKNILFDMTYRQDTGCMPNLAKYKPLYDPEGNFYNITLWTEDDFTHNIGISTQIDTIIYDFFRKQYKQILNDIHVDYRRKHLYKDSILFTNYDYTNETPAHALIIIMYEKLSKLISLFSKLGMNTATQMKFESLFSNYGNMEPYNWYKEANALV